MTKTLFERVRTWLRKPILVCGLVAGLAMGTAPAAHAEAWSFSYSGGGVNVTGVIYAIWDATYNVWNVTGISGTHNNTDAITGLWQQAPGATPGDNNYIAGPAFDSPAYGYNQADLHFTTASNQYAFGWIVGYNDPVATEGPLSNLDWDPHPTIIYGTGRCIVGQGDCTEITQVQFSQVPEINASAGLEALALLFVFGLIMREMFLRRRDNESLSA